MAYRKPSPEPEYDETNGTPLSQADSSDLSSRARYSDLKEQNQCSIDMGGTG
jgi:hypothetical protein